MPENEVTKVEGVVEKPKQSFKNHALVERLPLPKGDLEYDVPLFSKLLFVKNYEVVDTLSMGKHKIYEWSSRIKESDPETEFYMMFRINLKPRFLRETETKQKITYYDQLYAVNFKFSIKYNYSFECTDYMKLLKIVTKYKDTYTFKEMYEFIQTEINANLQSFISEQLPKRDISIVEFNTYTKDLSAEFIRYINTEVLFDFGLTVNDFNFMQLNFDEDPTFAVIKFTLFEKADMKLREYTYNDKAKYEIVKDLRTKNKVKLVKGEAE